LIDEVKANFETLLLDMLDSLAAESAISAKMDKSFLNMFWIKIYFVNSRSLRVWRATDLRYQVPKGPLKAYSKFPCFDIIFFGKTK